MKKSWLFLADRFDALAPRERFIVFIGLVITLVGLSYLALFEPTLSRYQKAKQQLHDSETLLIGLQNEEVALIQAAAQDPDAESRQQIAQLQETNSQLHRTLNQTQSQLATPEKMTGILRELINSQKGLELVSIRSGTTEDLLRTTASSVASANHDTDQGGIYKHSIIVVVRGEYAGLARYIRQLEAQPWKVNLASLVLKTEQYPTSSMTLTFHTISLDNAWLSF